MLIERTEMRAAHEDIIIRDRPALAGAEQGIIREGGLIIIDPTTRTHADGLVWVRHLRGWSPESSIDGTKIYMIRSNLSAFFRPGVTHPAPPVEIRPEVEEGPVEMVIDISAPVNPLPESKPEKITKEMPAVPQPEPVAKNIQFKVEIRVRVRVAPSVNAPDVQPDSTLGIGQTISANPNSRTEADGYVWIQHSLGWSAERNIAGTTVFLVATQQPAPPVSPVEEPDAAKIMPDVPAEDKTKQTSEMAKSPGGGTSGMDVKSPAIQLQATTRVRVRTSPSLQGLSLDGASINQNEIITVDPNSRIEADGYIWIQHERGWSAERTVNADLIFLVPPGKNAEAGEPQNTNLPGFQTLIQRLPVTIEQTVHFQYFGNNVFAYTDGKNFNYDGYSQGMHGGLDFLNTSAGIPVYAGVEGTYMDVRRISPNLSVWIRSGDYTLIYQHIINPRPFKGGDKIFPDTIIAEIEPLPWYHLHFEIRYQNVWIVNPLLLMPEDMLGTIMNKFNPATPARRAPSQLNYFYKSPTWSKWILPLDQPMLRLAGPLIGPRA